MGAWVDVTRFVLARLQHHLRPVVMHVDLFCVLHNFLYKLWWDEIHAFAVPVNYVARHHGSGADPNRHVYTREHTIRDRRRMGPANVNGHSLFRNTAQIANGSVHHEALLSENLDSSSQVVTNVGPALLFPV